MTVSGIHPSLILLLGALLVLVLPSRWRFLGLVGGPALALLIAASLEPGTLRLLGFLGYELQILRVDDLSRVFALILAIITLLGATYALHVKTRGEHVAALLYAAGALGVVFAGDWLTLFCCWELMAAASVFLIWYRGRSESLRAGFRYLLVHFIGGNLLLGGVLLLMSQGSATITPLTGTGGAAFWLVLLGVAINTAIVPLHAWLTDAYPEGTVTGSVFLSAFTTKVAVYVLIRVFPGTELLIWAGVVTALFGAIYAILETDARRLLSYSIISQMGFIVAAVGIGSELALSGATTQALNNILFKPLLFMGAGAVLYATGQSKLTELGGLSRTLPLVIILYTVGALAMAGVPLLNGFVSKSILFYSVGESKLALVLILLQLASIGTFLYAGLKLPYLMFFGESHGLNTRKLPVNMYLAMGGAAILCVLYGVYPSLLYSGVPYPLAYNPYYPEKILASIQLLLAAAAAFWLLRLKLVVEPKITLDCDWFYRKPLVPLWGRTLNGLRGIKGVVEVGGAALSKNITPYIQNPLLVPTQLLRIGPYAENQGLNRQERWAAKAPYDENVQRFPTGFSVLMSIAFLGGLMVFILLKTV